MSYNSKTGASDLVSDLGKEIKGKVVLVTGASPNSIGAVFAEAVAKAQPALLIVAGRSVAKINETANAISQLEGPKVPTRTLQLDLGSLATVREAAAQLNSWDDVPAIDVLLNNAGIMAVPFALSPDGIESQLATNHVGPWLFTNLIMAKILASSAPRVVNVSSDGHRFSRVRIEDYNFDVSFSYPRPFGWWRRGALVHRTSRC